MEYAVEGEKISPSELEAGKWETILRYRDRQRGLKNKGPASTDDEPAQGHGQGKSNSNFPSRKNGKKLLALSKKALLPRLPTDDYKIVCRPQGWNLRDFAPGLLLFCACEVARLPYDTVKNEDIIRVNTANNTFTLCTPDRQRATAYANIEKLNLQDQTYNVTSYVAAPEDSVKGVIYNAYAGDSPEAVRQGFGNRNEGIEVVDARRIGKSRTIQITFFGKKLPSQVIYQCGVFRVHPFREQHEVCYNCRRVGHRADVCYKPTTNLCRRCGENHSPPPEGEQPTCQPVCIVCNGGHNTGSRNCKFRLINKNKQGTPHGNQTPKQGDNDSSLHGHQSRPRKKEHGATGKGGSHSRNNSSSFPPLGNPAGNDKRSSSRGRSDSRSNKKVSWPAEASQSIDAREKEFQIQLQSRDREIASLKKELADIKRLLQAHQVQNATAARMPPTASQDSTNNAMETDAICHTPSNASQSSAHNATDTDARIATKRPHPTKEGEESKRKAEASEADTPQPSKAPTKLRADINTLSERTSAISTEQATFQGLVTTKFAEIDIRFATLEGQVSQIATCMQQIMDRLTTIEARLPPTLDLSTTPQPSITQHGTTPKI